jgi:hypothetical protein
VPIYASVLRDLGHGHMNEAIGNQQMSSEVLELRRGQLVEPVEQFRTELEVVFFVKINKAYVRTDSSSLTFFRQRIADILSLEPASASLTVLAEHSPP